MQQKQNHHRQRQQLLHYHQQQQVLHLMLLGTCFKLSYFKTMEKLTQGSPLKEYMTKKLIGELLGSANQMKTAPPFYFLNSNPDAHDGPSSTKSVAFTSLWCKRTPTKAAVEELLAEPTEKEIAEMKKESLRENEKESLRDEDAEALKKMKAERARLKTEMENIKKRKLRELDKIPYQKS